MRICIFKKILLEKKENTVDTRLFLFNYRKRIRGKNKELYRESRLKIKADSYDEAKDLAYFSANYLKQEAYEKAIQSNL